jgi:hypothetical protein
MRACIVGVCGLFLLLSSTSVFAVNDSDVAAAQADAARAQGAVTAAQSHVTTIVKALRDALEISPEYTAVKKELDDSSAARDSEKDKVLDQLHGTQGYQDACADRDRIKNEVDEDRKEGAAPEDITAAATAAMKASRAVNKMDDDALKNDPDYQADNKRYVAANSAMRQLEEKFKMSLSGNADWQKAKADLDMANAELTAESGKAAAAEAALNDEREQQALSRARQAQQQAQQQQQNQNRR